MSNTPRCSVWLSDAKRTHSTGRSLCETLYHSQTTILLNGQLGAGKTTFLQGFAAGLGIRETVTSPTYALEQRYKTPESADFIHLDLYRLNETDALKLVEETDDFKGVRCIEWAERLPAGAISEAHIDIDIKEESTGRRLDMVFGDMRIPDDALIDTWRKNARTPPHIIDHCEAVASTATMLGTQLIERGRIIRIDALRSAARIHDLLRFIDFRANRPAGIVETEEELNVWNEWRKLYPNHSHESACAALLRDEGFSGVADIVETHGLKETHLPKTVEQKLLFYADKRVIMDRFVTVDNRFDDFAKRYAAGKPTEMQRKWLAVTKQIEAELFPEHASI